MVTLAATGKVENGGPVVITATTLPQQPDQLLETPAPRGFQQYLECLDAEGCPADWADKINYEGYIYE